MAWKEIVFGSCLGSVLVALILVLGGLNWNPSIESLKKAANVIKMPIKLPAI
jgi:hypothetical protein